MTECTNDDSVENGVWVTCKSALTWALRAKAAGDRGDRDMPPGATDHVGKVVYRAVLQSARRFDRFPASKVLIHRYGIEGPVPEELCADKRLYAAGVEAFAGQRFAGAERLKWPLQRLVHNLGRQEFVNVTHGTGSNGGTQPASSTTTTSRCDNVGYSAAAVVLGSSGHPEVDASVREALEKFFPSNLKGVEGGDMYAAGFAALRELSSKWALAQTLGLDQHSPRTWRRAQKTGLPRRKRKTSGRARRSRTMQEPHQQTTPTPSPTRPPSPPPQASLPPTEPGETRVQRSTEDQPRSSTEDTTVDSAADRTGPTEPRSGLWESGSRAGGGKKPLSRVLIEPALVPAKGVYLISHPLLGVDPPATIFHRSVVLLMDHNEKQSYGLVVNKGRDVTLRDVVSPGSLPLASETFSSCFANNSVRHGGPVMTWFSWLHRCKEVGGIPVTTDARDEPVFFCGDVSKASDLVASGRLPPQEFSMFMGASTWDGDKLNQELAAGDWIMAKAPSELALSTHHNLWEEMLKAMGGEYAEMARLPSGGRWRELGAENRPCDFQP